MQHGSKKKDQSKKKARGQKHQAEIESWPRRIQCSSESSLETIHRQVVRRHLDQVQNEIEKTRQAIELSWSHDDNPDTLDLTPK